MTGGGGFIGSYAAEYYAKMKEEIIVFDNLTRAEILGKGTGDPFYNWNYLKNNYGSIKLVKGDIRNFKEVKAVSKNVDVIVHTAAQVAVTTSLDKPRIDFEINALGTLNILEAARLNDSAVLLCSTNKVYGGNVNSIPVKEGKKRYYFADELCKDGIPEDFPVDLCEHSPYGCSKLAADLYVQDFAYTYGLKTAIFRLSCIYGERQFGVEDQGWVAWFVIATITGKPITIYGDGKQVRDVLYITDLLEAFNAFINSKLKHDVFNIGGGPQNTLSLLELLELLEELTAKRSRISFAEWRKGDQKVYISKILKAKQKLGWTPTVSPREGVKKLTEWFSCVNSLRSF